ncbi:TetR/AcrR family transcriptional regulator [Ideonella sp. A 288]|uniref:TetR/AcrR family transcriptional regulator n=1 Tax=Ideonella sp. A 288 TaxID=1962181 RepID=UPI000B4C1605|nr:TetR/AcrR family transcriptional regulator [Ideonella sp. A 288]
MLAPAPPPRQAPPPTPRFQEKREAILAAAARLFNERGVRGATLADIAARVGLATNSVTYYYRKKEALATACFLRAIEVFEGLMAEAGRAGSVEQRVARFFQLHAELLMAVEAGAHPPLILFNDIRALPEPHVDAVFGAYTDMFRRMRGLLQGPETAALSRADLNARAHLAMSTAHWQRGWIGRYETDDYPRVARRVVDILLHGLAGPGAMWHEAPLDLGAASPDEAGVGTEAFLRAATVLVNEQGYRGASVDRISARLNVTKGSFYHHHDTKRDLISACFDRSFDVLRRALRAAEESPGPGWARVCASAVSLVRFQLSARGPLLRATATSAIPDEAERERVRRTMLSLSERLGGTLVDGMVDGSIRPLDPAIAAQIVSAAINAAAELQRWMPGATVDNVGAVYVRPALMGVLCPPLP